jgi:formylglycine-generating enzyme required for sulfatase activity
MPNVTRNLFISYRSSDAPKVDKIARDLALLRFDDGTPRFTTWQDKHNLPPASPHWWDAIVNAIIACEVFVFNLSRASLQSEICRAELDYAHKRNRPIVPLVLDGEFFLNQQSGKYDLPPETWALVPDWLGQAQFLFYTGTEFYGKFLAAMTLFERNFPRDINAPRPLNPDNKGEHSSNHALYAAACDYAERLAFAAAEKHFDALVRRSDADYVELAALWLEVIRGYAELIEMVEHDSPPVVLKRKWGAYAARFPNDAVAILFDPKGLAVHMPADVVGTPLVISVPSRVDLPAPLTWIEIPAGQVTLVPDEHDKKESYLKQKQIFAVPAFKIAKYLLTNAQFKVFVDAGGYRENRWWTAEGWQECRQNNWTEPHYWQDTGFNSPDQPVVGVSWYEASAFCQWLSEKTDKLISLPTEQQWQRAAQGDDGRAYPWGQDWDEQACQHSVGSYNAQQTSSVRQYEGRGDSPFGVVDLAGNVWEWCLTDYEQGTHAVSDEQAIFYVLRGGSWIDSDTQSFRCDYRGKNRPSNWDNGRGFRLALSL